MNFNGDTSAVYNQVEMLGDGASALTIALSARTKFAFNGYLSPVTDTSVSSMKIQVFDYTALDKHKSILARNDLAASNTTALAGRYGNTAAITSLVLLGRTRSFDVGSTFNLYGIAKAL